MLALEMTVVAHLCFRRQVRIRSETAVHVHAHVFSLTSHGRACLRPEKLAFSLIQLSLYYRKIINIIRP